MEVFVILPMPDYDNRFQHIESCVGSVGIPLFVKLRTGGNEELSRSFRSGRAESIMIQGVGDIPGS
jgi:hypothetical protein